ncbi:MAG: hypothetical protein ACOC45_06770 [Alkalispirochaetaceae bacterium]
MVMEQVLGEIAVPFSDGEINRVLKSSAGEPASITRHYTQGEDFFIKLPDGVEVPSFPIHHDVRVRNPDDRYLEKLRGLVEDIHRVVPQLLFDMTYMFDPGDILRPSFYQLYRIGGQPYLYLVKLDLLFRHHAHEVIEKGSNDETPRYKTRRITLEADFIPLKSILTENEKVHAFKVDQYISDTWIGETGRGYFVQGIWLDTELTKFFSKLFAPEGKRLYPFYPVNCKYRSICYSVIDVDPEGRKRRLPELHRIRQFLAPHMEEIQEALREESFSPDLETYRNLRNNIPEQLRDLWKDVKVRAYLNDEEMKEFEVSLEAT